MMERHIVKKLTSFHNSFINFRFLKDMTIGNGIFNINAPPLPPPKKNNSRESLTTFLGCRPELP